MAQHVTPFKDLNSLVIGVFQLITALLDAALDTCLSLSLSPFLFSNKLFPRSTVGSVK